MTTTHKDKNQIVISAPAELPQPLTMDAELKAMKAVVGAVERSLPLMGRDSRLWVKARIDALLDSGPPSADSDVARERSR